MSATEIKPSEKYDYWYKLICFKSKCQLFFSVLFKVLTRFSFHFCVFILQQNSNVHFGILITVLFWNFINIHPALIFAYANSHSFSWKVVNLARPVFKRNTRTFKKQILFLCTNQLAITHIAGVDKQPQIKHLVLCTSVWASLRDTTRAPETGAGSQMQMQNHSSMTLHAADMPGKQRNLSLNTAEHKFGESSLHVGSVSSHKCPSPPTA